MSQASPLLLDLFPRIDNTFGAILIATFLGIALYGLVIHQCYRYIHLYPKDSAWIKSLVVFTLVFETLHIVLSTHICYYYLVTSFGHPEALLTLVWSLSLLCVTTAFVGIPTKIFFALRIFRLGGQRYRVLAILTFILFTAELGFLSAGTVKAFVDKPFYEFRHDTWLVSAGAGMCLLADAFITAILVNLLRSKHIGVKRTDRLLKTLILYTINTGLLTGMMDLFTFLFALVSPNNFIYIAFGILTTKMYANSLLAALNTRNSLRYGPHEAVTITVPSPSPGPGVVVVPGRRQETSTFESESQKQATIEPPKSAVARSREAYLMLELVGKAV